MGKFLVLDKFDTKVNVLLETNQYIDSILLYLTNYTKKISFFSLNTGKKVKGLASYSENFVK